MAKNNGQNQTVVMEPLTVPIVELPVVLETAFEDLLNSAITIALASIEESTKVKETPLFAASIGDNFTEDATVFCKLVEDEILKKLVANWQSKIDKRQASLEANPDQPRVKKALEKLKEGKPSFAHFSLQTLGQLLKTNRDDVAYYTGDGYLTSNLPNFVLHTINDSNAQYTKFIVNKVAMIYVED